jgi:hypothetical protein
MNYLILKNIIENILSLNHNIIHCQNKISHMITKQKLIIIQILLIILR